MRADRSMPMVPDNLMVFAGNANPKLAQGVAAHLNILGIARFPPRQELPTVQYSRRAKSKKEKNGDRSGKINTDN